MQATSPAALRVVAYLGQELATQQFRCSIWYAEYRSAVTASIHDNTPSPASRRHILHLLLHTHNLCR
jgi:hypothetical protein